MGKRGRWDLAGFFIRLVRAVREVKPDILHGYLAESNLMTALLKPFVRGMKIIWGLRDSQTDAALYGGLGRLSFRLGTLLSGRADRIIANSASGRDYYRDHGYPRTKITVIPNGIDTERFAPDAKAGACVRAEWNLGNNAFVFGHVGRLSPMKDHATLLRAAEIVFHDHPRARLVCIGGGDENYAAGLRTLAGELGIPDKVLWLPPRPDMTPAYNAFDALVSSSSFGEGFSNVTAEAMACGVPCAATDVGDSAMIVNDARFTVPPMQPELLAAAMTRLISLDAGDLAHLTAHSRSRITQNFSTPHLIRRTREVLQELTAPQTAALHECLHSNA